MQSSFLLVALAALVSLPATLAYPGAGQCKPHTPTPPANGCDGVMVCCSRGLQGNVGYYCADGPMPTIDSQCGMIVVCCSADAKKDLTPRGYTWTGCSDIMKGQQQQ